MRDLENIQFFYQRLILIDILRFSLVNQLLLKAFFWLTVALLCLSTISLVSLQTASLIDRADLFLSLFSLLGLFGVAYNKQIFTVVFWRYFFYFGVIESFLYTIVLPFVGYERYEKPFVFNGLYVLEAVYTVILLYVLHLYAYRKPSVWMVKRS